MKNHQIIFENMLLTDLKVALKVAELGSITAAATSLDMQVATASAALKRVEKFLGVELFIRTTRQLCLSNAGERYIPQCREALLLLEQAKQHVHDELDIVEGELRIAMSSDLGRNIIVPWLDDLMEQHPKLSLRVNINDSNIDFYRDKVDVALRYGDPADANLYGFKICDVPRVLCASPAYLEKQGMPQSFKDLARYNGLFYQLYDVTHDVWRFSKETDSYKVKMSGDRVSNDGDLVRRWCVAGKGLASKSCLDMSADLLAGRVVNVIADLQPEATELWLICPSRQSITPAVRLLRDTLQEKCAGVLKQLADSGILGGRILKQNPAFEKAG